MHAISEFLRRAAAERAGRTLGERGDLTDIIGAVRSNGGAAVGTGDAFSDLLTLDSNFRTYRLRGRRHLKVVPD